MWRLLELGLVELEGVHLAGFADVPTELARELTPNSAPEIQRVLVEVEGAERTIHDLDHPIRVPVRSTVVVEPVADPIDLQFSIVPVDGLENAYEARFDVFQIEILTDDESDADVGMPLIMFGFAQPSIALEMPAHPATIGMWLIVGDDRGARSWRRARIEVVAL